MAVGMKRLNPTRPTAAVTATQGRSSHCQSQEAKEPPLRQEEETQLLHTTHHTRHNNHQQTLHHSLDHFRIRTF